ncbi:MAG: sugar transferase [Acidimicrobiia bacterium]|nr:sugar transferase [Acidimicrobiia bacterium]
MSSWLRVRVVLDRLVAVVAMLVLAPVVAVLAILVKRHDGGPAFIWVERVGRDFEPFMMLKLRSMRADMPDGRARGPALTAKADERITPVGRRLRSYHLDEIPQLVNVARGDMLLLGPRPEAPEYVDEGEPRWKAVLRVPPGIAGPTQLVVSDWERHLIAADPDGSAYHDVVLPVKLAIDEWYVETMSFARDLEVAVALLKRFLPGNQPTRMRYRVSREVPEAVSIGEPVP